MTPSKPDGSLLDPGAGARRLLELAATIDHGADPLAIVVATELSFRAAHILGLAALAPAHGEYSVALQALMHVPGVSSDRDRDALLDERDFLGWLDLLDLISERELGCVARRLHRGWQDRRQSCRQAREISARTLGFSVGEAERAGLLAAGGVCHRVLRIPPPARFDPEALLRDRRPLFELISRLAPPALGITDVLATLAAEPRD